MKRILSLAFALTLTLCGINAQEVKDVRQLNQTTVEVYYTNGQMLTLDFYGPSIFRMFQDPQGGIVRNPVAKPQADILVRNPRIPTHTFISKKGCGYQVEAGHILIDICGKSGLMKVTDIHTGKVVLQQKEPVTFDNGAAHVTLACQPEEYFYGGGVQNGRFSHRGQQIAIENSNVWVDGGVASPCPFYWSTGGYGVMFHTFKPGLYDFGATDSSLTKLSHHDAYLDMFVMVDDTPTRLLNDFYQLTGNPVLLPKFGFYQGHLNAYNRDYWTPAEKGFMAYEDGKRYNESQKDNGGIRESLNGELVKDGQSNYQFSARAAIDRYLNNDMPLGWFLPNDGYGAGYGQTGTLDGNVANLKAFGDYARSKGVEIGLWTQSDLHPKEGVEALLQRDIVKEVRDAGVRVLKTDVAWVGWGYSFGLNGVADVGEIMPYYGNNARPFIISLDGWAGTQRYAGIWSGDQVGGDWEYIRFHIPTFIGSGLSGQPNITNDMDGIFGGKNMPVNVRDFQWKTYTPMELNMDGWGSNPKYPQALGEPATSINRWYLKHKSQLLPYQYSIAREAVNGKPMIRAMFLDYPNAYTLGKATQYQFMFGPSLLVAPIYQNTQADADGNDIRNGIYLPEGKWYDYFSGECYEGGRILNGFDAPLWKLPVFAKAGAIIPMTTPNNNPSQINKSLRMYDIWPAGTSSFCEYDDDGVTQAYLSGACTETPIRCEQKGDKVVVTIDATTGDFSGFQPRKSTELTIHATKAPKKVVATVNGKKVEAQVEYRPLGPWMNSAPSRGKEVLPSQAAHIRVVLPEQDITTGKTVVTITGWENAATDPLLASHGQLGQTGVQFAEDKVNAYDVTPSWRAVQGADYYEVEFQGMNYTVPATSLLFADLQPETEYAFRVRAVNMDGAGAWSEGQVTTPADPYKWAVKGIKVSATCEDQPGTGVQKLFDFDTKTSWHSKWGKGEAVPFDMTLDLRGIVQLDRLEYQPRTDAGNGTLLRGTWQVSSDRENWSEPVAFAWAKDGSAKTINFVGGSYNDGEIMTLDLRPDLAPKTRYIRLHIDEAVGNFGSGQAMYVFRQEGTIVELQGDINRDGRIDENDLTSYMNYTGLRTVDTDFDYVSVGDINKNGLIDAQDISVVSTELDGGVKNSSDKVRGALLLTPSKQSWKAGDEVLVTVSGKDLHYVNGLSFGLPYSTDELEYLGLDLRGMKEMENLTYDRLHSNGQKELLPTFVNRGNNFLLEDGNPELFVIKFRAKKAGKWSLKLVDGMLVDRNLGVANF